jgi:methylenetetrahydrofolate dehydrogenase (NADP+)/methenyltetrahydrofolate cyclohydrolase
MDNLIDGKALAAKHQQFLQEKIIKLGRKPKIVSILVGDNPESVLYTKMKQEKASQVGVEFTAMRFPSSELFENVSLSIVKLNQDPTVDGIMVQLPLPKEFLGEREEKDLLGRINPEKDVDGLTENGPFLPAVIRAVFSMLANENVDLAGKFVVVVGSSGNVGKAMMKALKDRTQLIAGVDEFTPNLDEVVARADILISAVGKPRFITGNMVKDGVVVIDVGTTKLENGKLLGDADFDTVSKKASKLSPVPGGVGPMTVISLMENVTEAASGV